MRKATPHLLIVSVLSLICHHLGITAELIRVYLPNFHQSPGEGWIKACASIALAYSLGTCVLHIVPATARRLVYVLQRYLAADQFLRALIADAACRCERAIMGNVKQLLQRGVEAVGAHVEDSS